MPARRPRPCLDCGTLTRNPSRCDEHQAAWEARRDARRGTSAQRGYDSQWRRTAATAVTEWRAEHGDWCPGWDTDPHPATDLSGDHKTPLSRGGTNDPDNVQVLCRGCNSRKHAA